VVAATFGRNHLIENRGVMTIIRVNPASVQQYGTSAQATFAAMREALVALVNDVVAVRYFGPNAVSFKTQCGQTAADFANKLSMDMGAMADAIRTSTSNIASSLGGAPINIQVDPNPISPPVPASVDYVDVDTAALEAVMPVVTAHFTALREGLDRNLSNLAATDWEGQAKVAAVGQVTEYTGSAKRSCDAAQESIVNAIRQQIDAVTTADR
jgi:hypothetical protein